jgi:hypothetical protein
MGIHCQVVAEVYHTCPTTVAVGETNTGKTLTTTTLAHIISPDASKVLEYQSITPAILRQEVFAKQSLPVICHDPSCPEILRILVEETFDPKTVRKTGENVLPSCTAIVSCNDDFLAEARMLFG